jgi:hypothetical protein
MHFWALGRSRVDGKSTRCLLLATACLLTLHENIIVFVECTRLKILQTTFVDLLELQPCYRTKKLYIGGQSSWEIWDSFVYEARLFDFEVR